MMINAILCRDPRVHRHTQLLAQQKNLGPGEHGVSIPSWRMGGFVFGSSPISRALAGVPYRAEKCGRK